MVVVAAKIGFGFVTVAALLHVQAVFNALLLFAAVGLIPGTAITLSPDATIMSVIVVVAGVWIGVWRKPLWCAFQPPEVRAALAAEKLRAPVEPADGPDWPYVALVGGSALMRLAASKAHFIISWLWQGLLRGFRWRVAQVLRRAAAVAQRIDQRLALKLAQRANLAGLNHLLHESTLTFSLWTIQTREYDKHSTSE